ncbi:glycosyltransferase [Halostagnicola sp. A56]|uniref:glycosyltransferase n=1 Tax=Halostagnicola sp. A56 TaxID=1495067 RepID=UPI0018CE1BE3|nr:glycosyltransferase [Halostagnicola sp. A56]
MGDIALCQTPAVSALLYRLSNAEVNRVDGIVDSTAVHTAVESELGRESPLSRKGDIELVFVGRLVEIKDPTSVIELVDSLPSKYSLTIVGDGPHQSRVEAAMQEVGVCDRVQIAGRLPHKETLRVIYESDLLLLSSKTESYGAVVFEALSLNTPVLATPVGVLPTIDHPLLTTAELSTFENVLPTIDLETNDGIDEETLNRFSVDRFTQDVRSHLISTVER